MMFDNEAGHLAGRTAAARQLGELLQAARSGTPAVGVILGGQGMGKTVLVESFLRLQKTAGNPPFILRAAGAAWERNAGFGVVQQLLSGVTGAAAPLEAEAPAEPAPATGPGADGPAYYGKLLLSTVDRFTAEESDALVLWIDDLHWADLPSLKALLYALRRVGPRALLTIVAADMTVSGLDAGVEGLLGLPGARTIRLGPLTPGDVQLMARRTTGSADTELPLPAARILVEHTGGRPGLVRPLLEQYPVSVWSTGQRVLPVPAELRASVQTALAQLPPAAAALTEAAAVLGVRSRLAPATDLSGVSDPVAAVDEAVAAGLLELLTAGADTFLQFPIPAVRAAVYQNLGPGRRAASHAAAARLPATGAEQLAHRAAAALLPDGPLARELEGAAATYAASGAWGSAADAYAEAARLNPECLQRESLLILAVDAMVGAGQLPRAVTAVETITPSPRSDAVRGYLAVLRGRPMQADALLRKAWTSVDPATDPGTAGQICQRQVLHALARFNGRDLVTWAVRARLTAPPNSPPAFEAQAIEGLGLGAMGRYAEAEASYEAADRPPENSAQYQRIHMGRGWLHLAMDRLDEARTELAGAAPSEFGGGSRRIALWAQAWLARTDFALGAWDGALRTVENAVALQEESGIEILSPLLHWTGAQIHALRGNWDAAAHHLERAAVAADSYPIMILPHRLAQAQLAEVRADYDGVIRALLPVVRMDRSSGIDEPGFWPWQDHYANALVMVGQLEEADAFLRPHERLAGQRQHQSTMARLASVRGRIQAASGDFDAARVTFLDALARLENLPMPYARARIMFVYGQSFRRAGKRREAAGMLMQARDLFAVLGAAAYTDRCERELRASGVSTEESRRQSAPAPTTAEAAAGFDELTDQERAVASLVATGLTNKNAAAELYVSVKTVQYHLTRIYRKLHICSRSELAAAYLERVPGPGQGKK
jgi:DNA-binding CsgD family transcriptional regulator